MGFSQYQLEKMGHASISPSGEFVAGSMQSFTLTYTAGYFGIDDTGSIKIVHRFASDMGRPQFDSPKKPNYVTCEASNGAVLHMEYDNKRNVRPWDKTLFIRVARGFLREGDQIVVRFGDPRDGCPGMRIQTFCETSFEFRVLVDPFATYHYAMLPQQPEIAIIPGPPTLYKAVIPTHLAKGQKFRLAFKGEDAWGNPSGDCIDLVNITSNLPVDNLPQSFAMTRGPRAFFIDDLAVAQAGDLVITLKMGTRQLCQSNPCEITDERDIFGYWGDLHGQSEETIGTNSADDFFAFARDLAFLDMVSHQGNDFQITTPFWLHLNELCAKYQDDGKFVTFPGYEWSGNTGLGGDRNVLYREEGQPLHRSSHALVDDLGDIDSDANSANDLFQALEGRDCIVYAHIGGRYADITIAHDKRLELAVEVHSAWGTFEWLIEDAFDQGYRVGIVSNSDGHKGRPGASHPGATRFGSYGGLTCIMAKSLDRDSLMHAMRARNHYATTGNRMILEVAMRFQQDAILYAQDPHLGPAQQTLTRAMIMGDIGHYNGRTATLCIDILPSAPLERIELRNAKETITTLRDFTKADLGRRIRIVWEGSEYRGRGRETIWDGSIQVKNNKIISATAFNRYNIAKPFDVIDDHNIRWEALTTGGMGGFDLLLEDPDQGEIIIDTNLVKATIKVDQIGLDEMVLTAGGIKRQIRIFRLPETMERRRMHLEIDVAIKPDCDNGYYISAVQEDGHQIWSSPIYLIAKP